VSSSRRPLTRSVEGSEDCNTLDPIAPPASSSVAGPAPARFWGALCLIVLAQTLTVSYLIGRSFFFADDFLFLKMFEGEPWGAELFGRSVFGHMIPAYVLVQQSFGAWFGADWQMASVLIVLVQVGGTVAFFRLLTAMHGRVWCVPMTTAGFALSIVLLNNAPWWAATWTTGATIACALSAWGCAQRFALRRRVRHLVTFTVMLVLAVAFFEKSVALCAYVGLFYLLLGTRSETERARQRVSHAISLWPVWTIMVVVAGTDLAFYFRGDYLEEAGDPASFAVTLEYLARCLPEGVFPALLGIAYPSVTLPGPQVLTPVVASTLVGGVIVWSSWRSSLARRAWVWFLVCAMFSQLLLGRGRLGVLDLEGALYTLRYQVDATYLLLIALSVAVPAALKGGRETAVNRRLLFTVAAVAVLLIPGWVQSIRSISERGAGRVTDVYFASLRHDRAPTSPFLDLPVPDSIVPKVFFPWNMTSVIHTQIHPDVRMTDDPRGSVRLTLDGQVVPVTLRAVPRSSGEKVCAEPDGPPVQLLEATGLPVRAPEDPFILVADFASNGSSTVALTASTAFGDMDFTGRQKTFELAGRARVAAAAMVPPFTAVSAQVVDGTTVCFLRSRLATVE